MTSNRTKHRFLYFLAAIISMFMPATLSAQELMPEELLSQLAIVATNLGKGQSDAAAIEIRQFLSKRDQTLPSVLSQGLSPAYEAQYLSLLLIMDGEQVVASQPDLAIPIFYLSATVRGCVAENCLPGTHSTVIASSLFLLWALEQRVPPYRFTPRVAETGDYDYVGPGRIEPQPDTYGAIAGATDEFRANKEVPDPSLLSSFASIPEAFWVELNYESEQSVGFIEHFSAASGIDLRVEPTTTYQHFSLFLRYRSDLAARLVTATPALLERYDPEYHE